MKGTELSSFTQCPRRQSVTRSTTIALLALAGLLWWGNSYKYINDDNNVNPLDGFPGSGNSWHQVGFTTIYITSTANMNRSHRLLQLNTMTASMASSVPDWMSQWTTTALTDKAIALPLH